MRQMYHPAVIVAETCSDGVTYSESCQPQPTQIADLVRDRVCDRDVALGLNRAQRLSMSRCSSEERETSEVKLYQSDKVLKCKAAQCCRLTGDRR